MSIVSNRRRFFPVALFLLALVAPHARANAFVKGAYYRLGDDDPGAAAGNTGNDPTRDSFADQLHLARVQSPRYSADVPPFGPIPNKLSMSFANISLGGPAVPGYYGRTTSLDMVSGGVALETWVKNGGFQRVGPVEDDWLIAYNGQPNTNGFGFFLFGGQYVARIPGVGDRVLGIADQSAWHHLAYVYAVGTSSYYFDGKLVSQSTKDAAPLTATGGFWVGGHSAPGADPGEFLFNGWIDEVRYQSFNPLAAGAFEPTSFLITPEPNTLALLLILGVLRRRRFAPYAFSKNPPPASYVGPSQDRQ
jgi:Concanavalin A-like lectin/glucanases superfamily